MTVAQAKPMIARNIMSARNSLKHSQEQNLKLTPRMAPTVAGSIGKRSISQSPKPSPLKSPHSVMSHTHSSSIFDKTQIKKQSKQLTRMTHAQNAETHSMLSMYEDILSARNSQSSTNGFSSKQKSASQLLSEATSDIKLINYKLARIIPTESIHI